MTIELYKIIYQYAIDNAAFNEVTVIGSEEFVRMTELDKVKLDINKLGEKQKLSSSDGEQLNFNPKKNLLAPEVFELLTEEQRSVYLSGLGKLSVFEMFKLAAESLEKKDHKLALEFFNYVSANIANVFDLRNRLESLPKIDEKKLQELITTANNKKPTEKTLAEAFDVFKGKLDEQVEDEAELKEQLEEKEKTLTDEGALQLKQIENRVTLQKVMAELKDDKAKADFLLKEETVGLLKCISEEVQQPILELLQKNEDAKKEIQALENSRNPSKLRYAVTYAKNIVLHPVQFVDMLSQANNNTRFIRMGGRLANVLILALVGFMLLNSGWVIPTAIKGFMMGYIGIMATNVVFPVLFAVISYIGLASVLKGLYNVANDWAKPVLNALNRPLGLLVAAMLAPFTILLSVFVALFGAIVWVINKLAENAKMTALTKWIFTHKTVLFGRVNNWVINDKKPGDYQELEVLASLVFGLYPLALAMKNVAAALLNVAKHKLVGNIKDAFVTAFISGLKLIQLAGFVVWDAIFLAIGVIASGVRTLYKAAKSDSFMQNLTLVEDYNALVLNTHKYALFNQVAVRTEDRSKFLAVDGEGEVTDKSKAKKENAAFTQIVLRFLARVFFFGRFTHVFEYAAIQSPLNQVLNKLASDEIAKHETANKKIVDAESKLQTTKDQLNDFKRDNASLEKTLEVYESELDGAKDVLQLAEGTYNTVVHLRDAEGEFVTTIVAGDTSVPYTLQAQKQITVQNESKYYKKSKNGEVEQITHDGEQITVLEIDKDGNPVMEEVAQEDERGNALYHKSITVKDLVEYKKSRKVLEDEIINLGKESSEEVKDNLQKLKQRIDLANQYNEEHQDSLLKGLLNYALWGQEASVVNNNLTESQLEVVKGFEDKMNEGLLKN